MVDPGENVSATLKREFGEEALNSLEVDEKTKRDLQKRLDQFFANGTEVIVLFWRLMFVLFSTVMIDRDM